MKRVRNLVRLMSGMAFLAAIVASEARAIDQFNLVQNGDFSAGNVGFSSDASFVESGPLLFGEYTVRTESTSSNGAWCGADHTTGTGNYLLCDGFSGSPTTAWRQTLITTPGLDYSFSAFVANLVCTQQIADPVIELRVDGMTVAGPLTLPENDAEWVPIAGQFTATGNEVVLEIVSVSTAGNGNDFGIDDIFACAQGLFFNPQSGNFYQFVSGSMSWTEARDSAAAMFFNGIQGHLVTILSASEQAFVSSILASGESPWIGATDEVEEGTWRWVTGEKFWTGQGGGTTNNGLFANWGFAQPDDGAGFGSEDYAYMPGGNQWNDQPNSTPNPNGFVVEYDFCSLGTVNIGAGAITPVLRVNGSIGTITVATGAPITISHDSPAMGPAPASYVTYAWIGAGREATPFSVGSRVLGCFVNPTPLSAGGPQPFRCLRGGLPSTVCGGVREISGAPAAPWSFTRSGGVSLPGLFTLQGLVRDNGAGNPIGFSTTNAVSIQVE